MMHEVLVTVADVMTPTTLSVTTLDTVVTAAEMMRRERLAGLPVTEGDGVLGFVTAQQLLAALPYRTVGSVMTRGITPATPDLSLLQAYALMTRQGVEVLPVVDAPGRVVGQISITTVLKALGQQTDPLTGLPWATGLRAWATAALARGREVTILFIDLDNFGEVNKALGHIAGDDMLRSIAHLLSSLLDPGADLLCRYGGDEFAIATTRSEQATQSLLERIHNTIVLPVEIGGARSDVTISVGIAGGRRIEGRHDTHAAATVEDLLLLASRASTAIKEAKSLPAQRGLTRIPPPPVSPPAPDLQPAGEAPAWESRTGGTPGAGAAEVRLRLVDVAVHAGEKGCVATVTLQMGRRGSAGRATGPVHGRGVLYLVADATLAAIRQTIGEQHAYVLEELTEVPTGKDVLVVTVLSGPASDPRGYVGAARAPDPHQAVTKAVLDALNRPLARTLAEYLRQDTGV